MSPLEEMSEKVVQPILARRSFWEGFAASTLSTTMILTLTFIGAILAGPIEWAAVSGIVVPLGGALLVFVIVSCGKSFIIQWKNDMEDIRRYREIPLRQRIKGSLRSDRGGSATLPGLVLAFILSIVFLIIMSWLT